MKSILNNTGYFAGHKKRQLFYQSWTVDKPRGVVIITHGLFQNTDRYDSLARWLNQDSWNVYAWDLRGHGRSSGIRGYVQHFDLFEKDLAHFNNFVLKKNLNLPYVQVAHSLGGLIVARSLEKDVLLQGKNIVQGSSAICLMSPAFGLQIHLYLIKLILLRLVSYIYPWQTYYDSIFLDSLTNDPFFQQKIKYDPFRHNKVCPEIYLNILRYKIKKLNPISLSSHILIQLGGCDIVVKERSVIKYFSSLFTTQTKKMIHYPSGMHQLFEDSVRVDVIRDLKEFIKPVRI